MISSTISTRLPILLKGRQELQFGAGSHEQRLLGATPLTGKTPEDREVVMLSRKTRVVGSCVGRLYALMFLAWGFLSASYAVEAALSGLVTDDGAKPLADARVTLENLDTGWKRSVQSLENGTYRIFSVPT